MRWADVVLVQETKKQNNAFYSRFRRDWFVFHNPFHTAVEGATPVSQDYEAKAGGDIFIRKDFAYNFKIEHVVDVVGYVHHVSFHPCSLINESKPFFSVPFTVFNVYLPTDSNVAKITT